MKLYLGLICGMCLCAQIGSTTNLSNYIGVSFIERHDTTPHPYVVVHMLNHSAKQITGFVLSVDLTYADGITESRTLGIDGLLPYALGIANGHPDGRYLPGHAFSEEVSIEGSRKVPVRSVNVTPTMIVFDDKTALGDAEWISRISHQRQEELDAYKDVQDRLAKVASKGSSTQVVEDEITQASQSSAGGQHRLLLDHEMGELRRSIVENGDPAAAARQADEISKAIGIMSKHVTLKESM